ncbi:unnamed protein product [Haemonchus placei]|uniref:Craniofacial development protein 2-like n=1 Tax=Haemonchus placei TaxID=6290 RepID=A0A0N4W6S2_HAEPC|nr:unnamed protein product [Haemonchus placei]
MATALKPFFVVAWRDSIVSVERFDDRLMRIVVVIKCQKYHPFSAYAPQAGCLERSKNKFRNLFVEKTAEVPLQEVIFVAGDLNGHVGAVKDGYNCHGGFGYGSRNTDDGRSLEYADTHNLAVANTNFENVTLISSPSIAVRTQHNLILPFSGTAIRGS